MSDRKAKTAEFVLSSNKDNGNQNKMPLNKTMSVLQQAAHELAEEEHLDGYETMMIAADLLASERNLSSPLRNTPDGRSAYNQSLNFSQSLDHANLGASDRFQHISIQDIHEDALALMKDMKFDPIAKSLSIDDNVNALLGMAVKEGIQLERIKSDDRDDIPLNTRPLTTHTPLQRSTSARRRRQQSNGLNTTSKSFNNFSLSCEPSEISLRLNRKKNTSLFNSEIEEILFRSMHVIKQQHKSRSKSTSRSNMYSSRQYNSRGSMSGKSTTSGSGTTRQRIDQLSAPREAWSKTTGEKFASLDDAKECTFTPHIGYGKKAPTKQRSNNDEDDEYNRNNTANKIYAFISRQEAEERARREEHQFRSLKQDYDAKIDKKFCPNCHAQQSFDEVREKRKQCPACNATYVNKITWNQVSKHFFSSNKQYINKIQRKRQQLLREVMEEYETRTRTMFDPQTGRLVVIKDNPRGSKQVLSFEEQQLFFHRLEEYLLMRKEKLKMIENEMYDKKDLTFQPNIKTEKGKKSAFDEDSDEDDSDIFANSDDEKDVVERFLLRYEEDLEQRRVKMPERYLAIRKYYDSIKQREKYMKILNRQRTRGTGRDLDDIDDEIIAKSQYEQSRQLPFK